MASTYMPSVNAPLDCPGTQSVILGARQPAFRWPHIDIPLLPGLSSSSLLFHCMLYSLVEGISVAYRHLRKDVGIRVICSRGLVVERSLSLLIFVAVDQEDFGPISAVTLLLFQMHARVVST